ncbi:MAG: histidinol-phosphate aminotransferase family protein [Bacteroidetes bacterium]|nr:histidinol-phosphate aminotransferase family protein [Bacteroidota bacterium]
MADQNEKELVFLDRNENNYGPAPKCYEVLKNIDFRRLSWYSRFYEKNTKGELSLRLAKEYNLPEKSIVMGYGGEDLLKSLIHCYLKKGETLLIPSFSWWYYKSIASEVGGNTAEYPLYVGEESYHYDIEGTIKVYRELKPRIVFISSPNNPTGNSLTPEQLYQILDEMKDAIVVLDEAYAMFKTTDKDYVKKIVEKYPNTAIIRTFSKYYALAGVRIGFALIGKELDRFELLASKYLGYDRINEQIAIAALDSTPYYEKITAQMNQDKKMFYDEFCKLPGFKPYLSDANFMLVDMEKSKMAAMDEFLKKKGFVIKFLNEKVLNSQVRITIGTHEQNTQLINAIKEFAAG